MELIKKINDAIKFTDIYKANSDDIFIREIECVNFQLETILCPIDDNDKIAGRVSHGFAGFSSQYGGLYTYYFNELLFLNALDKSRAELSPETIMQAESIAEFWKLENTAKKVNDAFIAQYGFEPAHSYKAPGLANCDVRIAGTNVDFAKLIRLGLDGLDEEIKRMLGENGKSSFYKALHMWIDTLRSVCERYRKQAEEKNTIHFNRMADVLKNIQHEAPKTFQEGLQLFWIYASCSDMMNYGRLDDVLGELFVCDIDNGIITEEDAVQLVLGLYKHLKTINKMHDCRIIIGGKGRKHTEEADRLAIVFMEASRRFKETVPQLTLRYYKGMSQAVFQKAMEVNGEGCTFPIIYSDETNIAAVEKVYGVPAEEAQQYVPFGCGEYVLVGMSTGTPNNGINLLKALEMTLHNGIDKFHNVFCGLKTGDISSFNTFDILYEAYLKQLKEPVEYAAVHKMLNYSIAGQQAPYLHLSLLMDDCLKRGKPLLSGGVRYLNASSEVFGIISASDSFTAIKKYVYDEKLFSLSKVVEMLDVNFEGYEKERLMFLNAPKYGNDDTEADAMAVRVFNDISDMTIAAGKKAGLNRYAMVSVNNSMSAEWGFYCEASACGRKRGTALSNGNGPSLGADKNGITALLNSMAKFDASKHVGVINNIRLTKRLFTESLAQIKVLLTTFYENNGVQTNICVISKNDLENAMLEPEKYQNLIVRIGGFSARFVTLNPFVQREIIDRTTYDE
ncbi:MAG: hypothetical protein FWD47_01530 [Treponema sp.]|nr:hypothetical protein [Treponema sp.]